MNSESAKAAAPPQRRNVKPSAVTALLDKQAELRLASQFTIARQQISELARSLPQDCREVVLAGDPSGSNSGAPWPLSVIETFMRKLVQFTEQHPDAKAAAALHEIRAYKRSLDDARDGLILANLGLVVHIAKQYGNRGLPLMDLVQEGNLGLLTAVERFEHERGNRFSTYASWWIKKGIEQGIAEMSRTIRIPERANQEIHRVGDAARDLSQHLGRTATPREIATQLSMPVDRVDHALSIVREPLPLEGNVGDREGYNLANVVPDTRVPSPFHEASQHEIEQRVDSVLRDLTSREEAIVRMHFGIGSDAAQTLVEIGAQLRMSGERVRQIEEVALAKIKASPLCRELAKLFGVGERPRLRARLSS